jgi:hypothetical protein
MNTITGICTGKKLVNVQYFGHAVFQLYDAIVAIMSHNFKELASGIHGYGY